MCVRLWSRDGCCVGQGGIETQELRWGKKKFDDEQKFWQNIHFTGFKILLTCNILTIIDYDVLENEYGARIITSDIRMAFKNAASTSNTEKKVFRINLQVRS